MKEYCYCGCLKECHLPHQLDIHGGKCLHCKECNIYTWKGFLWTDEELKQKLGLLQEEKE